MTKKHSLTTILAFGLTSSAYADLGHTRAQIAAKYGQPMTVRNGAALVHRFWIDYENGNVTIHYNQKGRVTAVKYNCFVSSSSPDRNPGFTNEEFRAFLKDNGIQDVSKWSLEDFPHWSYTLFFLGKYPDEMDFLLQLFWDSRNTYPAGIDGGESQREEPVIQITIWTAEAVGEFAAWRKGRVKQ